MRPEPPGRAEDDADEIDHEVLAVVVRVLARRVPGPVWIGVPVPVLGSVPNLWQGGPVSSPPVPGSGGP